MPPGELTLQWLTRPPQVTPAKLSQIARCWQEVSNAGGAVGFPFPPVEIDEVVAATEEMVASLDPLLRRGAGLEDFYEAMGWIEVGRWPGALRFGHDDYRDNVLMTLSLNRSVRHPRL